ncbi:MAG: GNAT family N-acetyltransferase [Eubacterium sp.]|nr:GNAT family N-acetyltransferase [Eubacterium sp.]
MSEVKETPIDVRYVNVDDAEDVCRICCDDLGYQCDKYLVKERISQLDTAREAVFVAVADDRVVGYIHVEKYNTLYFEPMANILGLAVSWTYRKKGIGKLLINRAEKWSVDNEIALMRLNSGSSRHDAHEFYRHLGYGSEKEQIRFVKRIEGIE